MFLSKATIIVLFFYFLVCSLSPMHTIVDSSKMEATFVKKMTNSCGPIRLAVGWTDSSLTSCGTKCRSVYNASCRSFMYNTMTKLCTPGGRLSPSQSAPLVNEGKLYVIAEDDSYEGFFYTSTGSQTIQIAIYTIYVNYSQAVDLCQCLDSHLYVAKTIDKFNFFSKEVLNSSHEFWIGLDDLVTEGVFLWVDDGTPITSDLSLQYFQSDQPDNYLDIEDCVEMHWVNQKLNDDNCSKSFYFMCEKDVYPKSVV